MGEFFCVDEICDMNDTVLVDKSALSHRIDELDNPKYEFHRHKFEKESIAFWIEKFSRYSNLKVTKAILDETNNESHFKFGKEVKKISHFRHEHSLDNLRDIDKYQKNRRKLLTQIIEKNQFLEFRDLPIYKEFYKKYSFFKEKGIGKHTLIELNFDFCLSSWVLTLPKENRIAVISNDAGIQKACSYFSYMERKKNLYPYWRKGEDKFQRAKKGTIHFKN